MTRRMAIALVAALALLATGCGVSDSDRLSELEDENRELRGLLDQVTSSTSSSVTTTSSTTITLVTTTTTPTTTTTTLPAPTTTPPSEVSVLSITDGDTMRVLVDGANEPLRLIGINAPEGGECMAPEATTRLAELVAGGPVVLESDVSDRDQFGRLLRYVYAGEVFVNEALVREGLAIARRYEPDTARAPELEAAQAEAEAAQVGMWASDACGAAATGRIEIGHIHYDADGNDNFNLNDEWVEFVNPGSGPIDLTGWSVKDESASHRYPFPSGFTLEAEATVRLHTGCGADTASSLYWCTQGSAVWNNGGDTVFVLDPSGNIAVSESY